MTYFGLLPFWENCFYHGDQLKACDVHLGLMTGHGLEKLRKGSKLYVNKAKAVSHLYLRGRSYETAIATQARI